MEKGEEDLDPLISEAVGRRGATPSSDLSVRTTVNGTPIVAIAIIAPNRALEEPLKTKELSRSKGKTSVIKEPIGGSSLSENADETSTDSRSMHR